MAFRAIALRCFTTLTNAVAHGVGDAACHATPHEVLSPKAARTRPPTSEGPGCFFKLGDLTLPKNAARVCLEVAGEN